MKHCFRDDDAGHGSMIIELKKTGGPQAITVIYKDLIEFVIYNKIYILKKINRFNQFLSIN